MSRTTTAIWVIFMGVGGVTIRPPLPLSLAMSILLAVFSGPGARGRTRPFGWRRQQAMRPTRGSNCSDGGHSLNALSIEHVGGCRKGRRRNRARPARAPPSVPFAAFPPAALELEQADRGQLVGGENVEDTAVQCAGVCVGAVQAAG